MSSNLSSAAESYRLDIKESAAKELESLGTKKDRDRIVTRINALAAEPRPPGSEKLGGEENKYRVRQGNPIESCIPSMTATEWSSSRKLLIAKKSTDNRAG